MAQDLSAILKELDDLKQWKMNIGLKAITNADEYKKELEIVQTQNQKLAIQNELRAHQENIEHLTLANDTISEKLTQMKEDMDTNSIQKDEHAKLSQEALSIKDETISSLRLKFESLDIQRQTLESQLSAKSEQCNAQQMELSEFQLEMEKIKNDKNDLLVQLNELKENTKHSEIDQKMLCKQLNDEHSEHTNIRQQNEKISQQTRDLTATLKGIKQKNESLLKENHQYKQRLDELLQRENVLKEQVAESNQLLNEFETKYKELSDKYDEEIETHTKTQNLAADLQNQIDEMKKVQSVKQMSLAKRTKTKIILPQKTQNRLQIGTSTLRLQSITNTFQKSTSNLLTSMMSTLDTQSSEPIFLNMDTTDTYDDDDNESNCSDPSFYSSNYENTKSEASPSPDQQLVLSPSHKTKDILSVLSPNGKKSRKSSRSLNADKDKIERNLCQRKIFEMKLQQAIKAEMEALEEKMEKIQKEYEEELEKNQSEIDELIGAHAFAKKAYDAVNDELEVLRVKYHSEVTERHVELSGFSLFLSHIFAI